MISSAMDLIRREPVPHRWHVLQVLRSMRAGHPFIRLGDMSNLMHLEGVPLAVHYFDFLERNAYITARAQEGLQAHYYKLTPGGVELYETGEHWWGSLSWQDKIRVMWGG